MPITVKHEPLSDFNDQVAPAGAIAAIQYLGSPIGDGYNAHLVQNGKYFIVVDPTKVLVGDIALNGNIKGVVTLVSDERIKVSFDNRHIQEIGVDPVRRVISYDFLDNSDGATDDKKYPRQEKLLSAGVIFMRRYVKISPEVSMLWVDKNAADADSTDEVTVTVDVRNTDGDSKRQGGDDVVISDSGDGVVGTVTDNDDGTYTATVVNGTAETTNITATINGDDVGDPDSEEIVWT